MEDYTLLEHQLQSTWDHLQHLKWYSVPLCVGNIFVPLGVSKNH